MTPSEQRQAWLETATKELQPLFARHGKPLPEKLRISMGWPQLGKRAMGECYHARASSDEHREIFISPAIIGTEEILVTVAHELCHAALPDGVGHRKPFAILASQIGLDGSKPTRTPAGPAFKWWLANFVGKHGEYPAGTLNHKSRAGKQETAMLKCECATCGYIVRTTKKWIFTMGAPHCPQHGCMEVC